MRSVSTFHAVTLSVVGPQILHSLDVQKAMGLISRRMSTNVVNRRNELALSSFSDLSPSVTVSYTCVLATLENHTFKNYVHYHPGQVSPHILQGFNCEQVDRMLTNMSDNILHTPMDPCRSVQIMHLQPHSLPARQT